MNMQFLMTCFGVILFFLPANGQETEGARRISLGTASLLVQKLEGARSWDEARKMCKTLGDRWDLPNQEEYLVIIMSGNGISIPQKKADREPSAMHLLWARADSEQDNQREFVGTSKVYYMEDGKGYDTNVIDLSEQGYQQAVRALQSIKTELIVRKHIRTDEEEEKVEAALVEFRKKNPNTWLNMEVPHPDKFSNEINQILAKVSVNSVKNAEFKITKFLEATKDGLPVLCVQH